MKDGKLYRIPRRFQISQAAKAGIDYRIGKNGIPETAGFPIVSMEEEPEQVQFSL